jgi:steroid 5-alpha reductase family enzyme
MLASIPLPARSLGLAGLIPFWACALGLALFPGAGVAPETLLRAQVAYGAVILTFLGGVHWGVALRQAGAPSWLRLAWGVTPSLIAWCALLLPPRNGLGLLAFGLAIAFGVDLRTLAEGIAPDWYPRLRRILTTGALAALFLSILVA